MPEPLVTMELLVATASLMQTMPAITLCPGRQRHNRERQNRHCQNQLTDHGSTSSMLFLLPALTVEPTDSCVGR